MQNFDTSLCAMEDGQSILSAFEQTRYDRLSRCSGAEHGTARLLEKDGIEKDSGGEGMLDAFATGGLTHALNIVSLCAEDSLDALESHAEKGGAS